MSDAITSADHHLREALTLLRKEESERLAAFDREMAHLRQRIAATEAALSPEADAVIVNRVVPPSKAPSASPRLPRARQPAFIAPPALITQLGRMTQTEALIRIAQYFDGTLRTAEAKQILISAGLIKGNPRNALGHLYTLLGDPDRFQHLDNYFEKVGPGVFRLIPKQPGRNHENQGAFAIDLA